MKIKAEYVPSMVTAAAFTASAAHIVTVVNETNPFLVALAYPLGIDGLIYVGIDAMQKGRKAVGTVALLVGSVYSLLFNADAEKALEMHPLLIAASMPVCLFASFLIAYTGKKPVEVPAPIVAPAPIAVPVPAPIVAPAPVAIAARRTPTWVGAGVRPTLPIVSRFAPRPVIKATVAAPKPAAVATPKPAAISSRPETKTAGRSISWDVTEAVRLMDEGKTNDEIGSKVGTAPKQIQRARRVLGFVRTSDMTDAEIRETISNQLSMPVIAAIRKAA